MRAIGPLVLSCATNTSSAGQPGTRPWLGRNPNTLFQPAGLRRLPMKSLPSATGSMRVANATAAPPLLPPADLLVSKALSVVPNTSLKVCEPRPNSGVLVLPITMQPEPFIRCTIKLSSPGTESRSKGEPNVVRSPAVAATSLIAWGTPCSHPRRRPR